MKSKTLCVRALLVMAATLLVAGVLAMAGCACSSQAPASSSNSMSTPDTMTVPNVVSLTQADADKALASAGFAIGTIKQEASDTVPQGSVISQDPKAFTSAKAGTKVNLAISTGKAAAKDVTVPDLKGKTKADAEKALADVKLVGVASNPEETTEATPGHVFKQSVAAGTTVKEGTNVAFTVALAPSEVAVPEVTGKSRDDAKSALVNAGLGFDYTVVYNDVVAENLVISQSIGAGTKVKTGTTVSVIVSLGPKPVSNVKVPDVNTFSWSDAEAALKSAGLQARYTGDPSGVVVAQDIAPGTEVAPNTMVTVTLGGVVETVEVPNVVGMSVTSAENAVSNAKLTLDIVEGGNHGTVKEQWPSAGTQVPVNSTVNVKVDDSEFRAISAQAGSASGAAASASAASASAASASAASAFVGNWAAGNATVEIAQNGDKVTCTVTQKADGGSTTVWKYDCTVSDGKLVAKNTGTKSVDGAEPAYKDGSATFSVDNTGKLVWKDEKEDAGKGLTFDHK